MYDISYGMGLGHQDPWRNQKLMESAIRVEEHSRKAEIDIGKAATLLEVSTNIKVDIQTQRMKVHFDEDKKSFYVMIPHVRVSTTGDDYRLRKLFEAEGFVSESWTREERIVKLRISFISLPSGRSVNLILDENECSGKGLRKAFRKEGLVMQISQQYEAGLFEDVLYCLIAHASEKHVIFPHLGWNKVEGKWFFSSKTCEEIHLENAPDMFQMAKLGIPKTYRGNVKQLFFEALLGYILNQEILKEMGLRLQRPLAVIVDTDQTAEEVKRFHSTFVPVKEADSYLTPKRLSKMMEIAHSEPIFYASGVGRYNEENLNLLISCARSGQLHGKITDGFPILFFLGWIPDQWRDKVLAVNICEEDMYFSTFGYAEKAWIKALSSFPPYLVGQACENARDICREIGGNLKVLLSAYYIMTYVFREPIEAELLNTEDAICRILKDAEEGAVSDILEVFLNSLYEWIAFTQFSDCFQRCRNLVVKNLNHSMLYDESYLYLPENIFNQIIRPIKAQVSSLEIKIALKQEGVLVCQNSEGYTINLLLSLSTGFVKHRFYRLDRQAIKKPGELEIVELCELYKNS